MRCVFCQFPVAALCAFLLTGSVAAVRGGEAHWLFHDPSFARIERPGSAPELLASGFDGCEGAQWIDEPEAPGGGHLRFGAVHTDVAFRWDEKHGLRGLRAPSFEASAFRRHPGGGLIVAEQSTRRIVRYEDDGSVKVLVDRFEGMRLNRPNDVAVRRDGTVWFTDPDYLFKQRPHETKELPGQYVYCYNPASGDLRAMVKDLALPNGIAFAPDESVLYIGDSRKGTVDRWPVRADGSLGARESFVRPRHRAPDGIACDRAGNLWIASARAIEIFAPDGRPLAELSVPGKRPAAVAFGGRQGDWVFVCTRDALWRVPIDPPQS